MQRLVYPAAEVLCAVCGAAHTLIVQGRTAHTYLGGNQGRFTRNLDNMTLDEYKPFLPICRRLIQE